MLVIQQSGCSEHVLAVDECRNVVGDECTAAPSGCESGFHDCNGIGSRFEDATRRDEARR